MKARLLPVIALTTASPAMPQDVAEDSLMAAYRAKTQVVRPCDRTGDAIVVCGTLADRNASERLPLPREEVARSSPLRGEPPRASAALAKQGSCGVVGGQGTGCTGGLPVFKMVGALAKVVTAIADPDADLSSAPPERIKGAGRH